MAELAQYSKIGGRDPDTLKQLAKLQSDAGEERCRRDARTPELDLSGRRRGAQALGDLYLDLGNANGCRARISGRCWL